MLEGLNFLKEFSTKKHILLIFNENRPISSYPYLLNFIRLISASGFKITFLINDLMIDNNIELGNVEFISVSDDAYRKKYFKSIISYFFSNQKQYDYIISASIEGLWLHLLITLFSSNKIRGAYFSMELFETSDFRPPKWLKILWRIFHWILKYRVDFSVIQDKNRELLLKETLPEVCDNKIFLLPNSYLGFTNEKSNFAYEKFGIDKSKKILLYAGAIEEWAIDINFPKLLSPLFNEDYVLVLSGFSRDNFVKNLSKIYSDLIQRKKLLISLEILSEKDFTELVKSAYIGLAWYKQLDSEYIKSMRGKNVYYMGMSSGKLMKYLSCDVPIIVPNFYFGYSDFVKTSNAGVACSYDSSIVDGIRKIDANILKYRKSIETYYINKLEYSQNALPIVEYLISLVR